MPKIPFDSPTFWRQVTCWFIERPVDEAVNRLLGALGRAHRADRAWVIRYSPKLTHFSNSHEWVRPGVRRFVKELQDIPVAMLGPLHREILAGRDVFYDTRSMPPGTAALRAELKRQGSRTVLCIPLRSRRQLVGFAGYDGVRSFVTWTPEDAAALHEAARIISAAIERSRTGRPSDAVTGQDADAPRIFVRQGESSFALPPDQLLYIESAGDYTRLVLSGGRPLLQLKTLTMWENVLPPGHFLRIHRRYLVNRTAIRQRLHLPSGDWQIGLGSGHPPLPVGRSYRHLIRQQFPS
ncbi:phytochrome sensor protein [Opitutaceae bacterium TAV5]|nr:phytochrome sensor protein [Opitutaceae bacterium TAV5]